jgi:hypothetical protein
MYGLSVLQRPLIEVREAQPIAASSRGTLHMSQSFRRTNGHNKRGIVLALTWPKHWKGVLAKRLMREEDANKILAAADKGFLLAGLTNFEAGLVRVHQLLERILEGLSRTKSRDAAKSALMEGPEISPEKLEELLSFLENIPYRIREMVPEVAKNIPHEPGGRPRSLTEAKKRQVCTEIGSLYGRGVRVGIAVKRVAQKFGVSERTVRRAWRERGSSEAV